MNLLPVILVLSTAFLFFDPWLALVEVVLGTTLWTLLISPLPPSHPSLHTKPRTSSTSFSVFFLLAAVFFLASRLYPFFLSSAPLGYDTGIYRYEFWSSFQALPDYISGIFLGLPLISNVFLLFGSSIDELITMGYVATILLAPFSLLLLLQGPQSRASLALFFLYACSLIQWKAYTMILFKQLLALSLSFFSFWLIQKRSVMVVIPILFLLLLQPLDALLVSVAIAIYALAMVVFQWGLLSHRYFFHLFLILAVLVILVLLLEPVFWQNAWALFSQGLSSPETIERSLQKGVFVSLEDYGYQSAFFFVFGVLGWLFELKYRRFTPLAVYFLVLIIWIAFHFFFYQRLLIQFDAVLIFFAAFSLVSLFRYYAFDVLGKTLFVGLILSLAAPLLVALVRFSPLMEEGELKKITRFCQQLPPSSSVVATDSYYAPWLRGYCLDGKASGPGLFGNPWSEEDWHAFWAGDKEKTEELLEQYHGPLYFYVGEKQAELELSSELFEWLGGGWYRKKE